MTLDKLPKLTMGALKAPEMPRCEGIPLEFRKKIDANRAEIVSFEKKSRDLEESK